MKTYLEVCFQETGIEVVGYQAAEDTPDIINRHDRIVRIWGLDGIVDAAEVSMDLEIAESRSNLFLDAIALYKSVKNQPLREVCSAIFHRQSIGAIGAVGIVVDEVQDFLTTTERFSWTVDLELEEDGISRFLIKSYVDFEYATIFVIVKPWTELNLKTLAAL